LKGTTLNQFGGNWTKKKIEILVEYAKAYLTIMKNYPYWQLLYFDGFAGSGLIIKDRHTDIDVTIGSAMRIIEIEEPRAFNNYYFVEKNKNNALSLEKLIKENFPDKKIIIKVEDCNVKLKELSNFLQSTKGKKFRVLAYIDPCGMQLEWNSLEKLAKTNIDIWILVPTGLGVNRLLKKNGEISNAWLKRLSAFLGLSEKQIRDYFYKEETDYTLFGEEKHVKKEVDAISKSATLYRDRLNKIFKYVTQPFVLKSTQGNVMYHMFMASNNKTAQKIANDIIAKYNNQA